MSMDVIWPNRPQKAQNINRCKCDHFANRHDERTGKCFAVGCGCTEFRSEVERGEIG